MSAMAMSNSPPCTRSTLSSNSGVDESGALAGVFSKSLQCRAHTLQVFVKEFLASRGPIKELL